MRKKVIQSFVLFSLIAAGCSQQKEEETSSIDSSSTKEVPQTVEAKKVTLSQGTMFDGSWNDLKTAWSSQKRNKVPAIGELSNEEVSQNPFHTRYQVQLNEYLFAAAEEDDSTQQIDYGVVMGLADPANNFRNTTILNAAVNLVEITDRTLTHEQIKDILWNQLDLDQIGLTQKSYSLNGILYEAKFEEDEKNEGYYLLTVEVKKET